MVKVVVAWGNQKAISEGMGRVFCNYNDDGRAHAGDAGDGRGERAAALLQISTCLVGVGLGGFPLAPAFFLLPALFIRPPNKTLSINDRLFAYTRLRSILSRDFVVYVFYVETVPDPQTVLRQNYLQTPKNTGVNHDVWSRWPLPSPIPGRRPN